MGDVLHKSVQNSKMATRAQSRKVVDKKLRISEKLQRRELRFALNGRAVVTDCPATRLLLIQDKTPKLQLPQLLNFRGIKTALSRVVQELACSGLDIL